MVVIQHTPVIIFFSGVVVLDNVSKSEKFDALHGFGKEVYNDAFCATPFNFNFATIDPVFDEKIGF